MRRASRIRATLSLHALCAARKTQAGVFGSYAKTRLSRTGRKHSLGGSNQPGPNQDSTQGNYRREQYRSSMIGASSSASPTEATLDRLSSGNFHVGQRLSKYGLVACA